jgi:hypothetical protein
MHETRLILEEKISKFQESIVDNSWTIAKAKTKLPMRFK